MFWIDKDDFNKYIDMYYKDVYNFCKASLKSKKAVAEDITQEVFLYMTENQEMLVDKNIKSWLFSVAKYKIFNYYKKLKKEPYIEINEENLYDYTKMYTMFSNEDNVKDFMVKILKELDSDEKKLIELRYIKCMNIKEISDLLNIKEVTVYKQLNRLKTKLKKQKDLFTKNL